MMTNTEKAHEIELRVQAIETRLSLWRRVAVGVVAFFCLGNAYAVWDLYNRALNTADIELIEAYQSV